MRNKQAGLRFLLSQAWCIAQFGMERILGILESRAEGDNLAGLAQASEIRKARTEALMYAQAQATNKARAGGHKHVAMIPIHGMLMSRMGGMEGSGIISQQSVGDAVARAGDNKDIGGIILHVDSVGGTAAGNEEAGDIIRQVAQQKPMATFVSGEGMYSAAYWLGSQSGNVFLAGDTIGAGSIGTIYGYLDDSQALENKGLQYHWIRSGSKKALGGEGEKLTPLLYEEITRSLVQKQSAFLKNIALGLNISPEEAIRIADEGQIWYGQEAVQQGVAHGIRSLDQVIQMVIGSLETGQAVRGVDVLQAYARPILAQEDPIRIGALAIESQGRPPVGKLLGVIGQTGGAHTGYHLELGKTKATSGVNSPVASPVNSGKEKSMTPEELKEKYPHVYQMIYGDGVKAGKQEAMSAVAMEMGHVGEGFDLKAYAQQARDGKGYRDHLEGRLLQVCVTMHGAEQGTKISTRMATGFKTMPVSELEAQVVLMETESQAKIPAGRLSQPVVEGQPAAQVFKQVEPTEVMDFASPR